MATVNLGAIRFNWKGAYNNGTAYVVDDVVSSGGNSYICILASTGNAVSNATYWSIMSAAGTDLTSTLTTQGDVLFRDGSGLQRLAKGTAEQVLSMNSGATAPEWAAAGGGAWTLIESVTANNDASLTITGLDTSVYATYVILTANLVSASADERLVVRLGDSGGIDSGSTDYSWVAQHHRAANGAGSISVSSSIAGADGIKLDWPLGYAAGESQSHIMYLSVAASGLRPHLQFDGTCTRQVAANDVRRVYGSGMRCANINVTQVQFLASSGNLTSGRITIYGIKHT